MPDGEEPVVEPSLESLQHADVKAQSTLLLELATALAQLTARDRVVGGDGAHGSVSGQRIAGQPTGSGGAAERPDLLELAQSGRVGAKSVSAEDDYLAKEYLWMSCFGAHMSALFVALDELLPYVPAASQDFTPYLARARNHAEAIDKAFRFRLAFLRRLNEIKRVHDELGQRTLDMLSSPLTAQTLKSYAGRLSQFAEFCHDSENISPLEATTATVVRYVAWIEYQYNFRALMASVVNFMFFAKGLTGVSCRVRDVHVDDYNITLRVYREKAVRLIGAAPPAGTSWTSHTLRKGAASAANAIGTPLSHIRYHGGWATNSDVVSDYIDPNVLPSPGAWFFFGHIAPLRHFHDSAAEAFPRLVVTAKRSEKKKQARKTERRQELADFRREREERVRRQEAADAAAKVPPLSPPSSLEDAEARAHASTGRVNAVALELKARKAAARESGAFTPQAGFKLVPEVQESLQALDKAKVALLEARLELALWQLAEVTGRTRHLQDYNWSFGAGAEENTACFGYILGNCKKFDVSEAALEVVQVMRDAALGHAVEQPVMDWLEAAKVEAEAEADGARA
eukprot:jgi/Tetstr1/453142/TSEL_040163.t1